MPTQDSRSPLVHRVRAWPRRVLIGIAVVLVVLVAARIALPFVVKDRVNDRLASIPGYGGAVGDIGISLIRGAYSIHDLAIFKVQGEAREPYIAAKHIDFSIAWRELFRGKIVSDIYIDGGEVHVVKTSAEESSQKDIDRRWQEVVKDLFPIDITHLELKNGFIRYRDTTKAPHVDLFVKNMHVLATGLRNQRHETAAEFPAHITLQGESLGGGRLDVVLDAEPLAPQPHFELKLKVDDVQLPALNDSLKAIANVDVSRGTFRLAAEMAGRDGGFQGYVKPFFEDVDFNNIEDKKKGVLTRIWENVVQGLAWLVKNKSRDQVATRIPFQGRFGDPQVGLLTTITNLFRHGFVRAFNPTIEGSVEAENVLPSGASADGKNVADVKDEGASKAGAPTGRPRDSQGRK